MVEKLRTVMRVFSAAKGAVEIGMRATDVLSAPRAERSRQIVEECGAIGGGMVGGSIGAAAGGEIGAVASPVGSLVGACLGGCAGGFGGERLGRSIAGALYDRWTADEPAEPAEVIVHPYAPTATGRAA